jgi:hypothetical protein
MSALFSDQMSPSSLSALPLTVILSLYLQAMSQREKIPLFGNPSYAHHLFIHDEPLTADQSSLCSVRGKVPILYLPSTWTMLLGERPFVLNWSIFLYQQRQK